MSAAPAGPPVVLLGGSLTALSACRSLGGRGIEVVALHDGASNSVVRYSRHCSSWVSFAKDGLQEAWLEWLLKRDEPSVILPCCDSGVELVARQRHLLESAGHHPVEADDGVLVAMLSKEATFEAASEAGIAVPYSTAVRSAGELEEALGRMAFPCATKPEQPNRFLQLLGAHSELDSAYGSLKGLRLEDASQARAVLEPLVRSGIPMLLTEMVEGPDSAFCSYYSYLDSDGNALFHFTKRKLRQYPIHFGGGTYHKTEWIPEAAEAGLRFFERIGLRGIGNVEFKRDARDGRLKLIECNPRITASDNLIRAAGVDLAFIAYLAAAGEDATRALPTRAAHGFVEGLYQWLPGDDLRAALDYRRSGELSLRSWAASLLHVQRLAVFDLADPLPAAVGAKRTLASYRSGRRGQRSLGGVEPLPSRPEPGPLQRLRRAQ